MLSFPGLFKNIPQLWFLRLYTIYCSPTPPGLQECSRWPCTVHTLQCITNARHAKKLMAVPHTDTVCIYRDSMHYASTDTECICLNTWHGNLVEMYFRNYLQLKRKNEYQMVIISGENKKTPYNLWSHCWREQLRLQSIIFQDEHFQIPASRN